MHQAEAAAPAQQMSRRGAHLLQRAPVLTAGIAQGSGGGDFAAAWRIVRRVAHHQIERPGREQGADLTKIPCDGAQAVPLSLIHI